MRRWIVLLVFSLGLGLTMPLSAGQVLWETREGQRSLTLLLGGGPIEKTLEFSASTERVALVLKKFLLEEETVRLEWKAAKQLWLGKNKKIPDDSATEIVVLPPGKTIQLEVRTLEGALLASITLLRK